MSKIIADLHMHTTHSDGLLSPKDLQSFMKEKGLEYISITDHDTINAYSEIDSRINVIMGVEFTCYLNDKEIHLLAYNFDPSFTGLQAYFENIREQRDFRAESIIKQLHTKDIQITFEELKNRFPTAILTRSHIAQLLSEKGVVYKPRDAFKSLIADWHLNLPKVEFMTAKEAITIINKAGGFTSLAHPGKYYSDLELYYLVKCGMKSIEISHPSHKPLTQEKLQSFVKQYSLHFTGGSDYHARTDYESDLVSQYGLEVNQFEKLHKNMSIKLVNL
jgi:hypothetical protein